MTTGKTIALTRQAFVGKVMSLLFNRLSHELPDIQAGFREGNHEEVFIRYKIRIKFIMCQVPCLCVIFCFSYTHTTSW